jgi:hypothetical protein
MTPLFGLAEMSSDRRYHHYGTTVVLSYFGDGIFQIQLGAFGTNVECLLPLLFHKFENGRDTGPNSGVVHEDIEFSKALDGFENHRLDRVGFRNIVD